MGNEYKQLSAKYADAKIWDIFGGASHAAVGIHSIMYVVVAKQLRTMQRNSGVVRGSYAVLSSI
jgi:hypothetical protein